MPYEIHCNAKQGRKGGVQGNSTWWKQGHPTIIKEFAMLQ